jgi:hypothetical protein
LLRRFIYGQSPSCWKGKVERDREKGLAWPCFSAGMGASQFDKLFRIWPSPCQENATMGVATRHLRTALKRFCVAGPGSCIRRRRRRRSRRRRDPFCEEAEEQGQLRVHLRVRSLAFLIFRVFSPHIPCTSMSDYVSVFFQSRSTE